MKRKLKTCIILLCLIVLSFENVFLQVSSLLFVPSHQVSLCSLGVNTALILDVGYVEAVLIPVFEGVPVLHAWQAQPRAAQAVER
jgi:actin-related protein 10